MGYRDKTWCKEDTCKYKDQCPRFFTDKDREEAIKWWGDSNFPIAMFTNTPACYERD